MRKPGFLMLATGVLALGIGASVAVFALINGVLLRPLPFPQPAQLVQLGKAEFGVPTSVSPQEYQHLTSLHGVQSIGLIEGESRFANISADGTPALVPLVHADRGWLRTLGVRTVLGRNFTEAENRPNGPKVVLLSHGFWMRRYGAKADAVGRSLSIEGNSYVIVGVVPGAVDLKQADLVLPFALPPDSKDDGGGNQAIARLAPGTTVASVSAQADARIYAMVNTSGSLDDKAYWKSRHFLAGDLKTSMRVFARPVLLMFLVCALLVLLIAVVNLSNLVLLRALSRSHETAVREALGAPWVRRVLPMLAESLLIGLAGALAGWLLALLGVSLLRGLIPPEWLVGGTLRMGAAESFVALGLGMASALLAAALGVWRGFASLSLDALREGGRSGMGKRGGRFGRALVVAQMALATTLLCAAGLFLHALYDAARAPLGFSTRSILTFELAPITTTYPNEKPVQRLTQQVLDQLRAEPGVVHATATTGLPAGDISQNFYLGSMHVPGEEAPEETPQLRAVGADFFSTFGIVPTQGRVFRAADIKGAETVAVINQAMANRLYAGRALGRIIDLDIIEPDNSKRVLAARIVGVIGNISPFGPLGEQERLMYLPLAQMPPELMQLFRSFHPLRFAIRVRGNPNDYRKAVIAAVAKVAPDQPVANVRSMQSIVQGTTADTRLNLLLTGVFALLALLLAAVGVYAVMSVAVTIREREFGIRAALGASPRRLMQRVLRDGSLQTLLGLGIGMSAAVALAGVMRPVLLQIQRSVFDMPVVLTVGALLTVVGLLACLIPAMRAARVQPMQALRGE